MTDDVYDEIARRVSTLASAMADGCAAAGFAARFPVVHTLFGIVCGEASSDPVRDFDDAKRTDEAAYAAFFQEMLAHGVAMAPGAYEAIFVGLAHDDAVIDRIAEAAHSSARGAVSRLGG